MYAASAPSSASAQVARSAQSNFGLADRDPNLTRCSLPASRSTIRRPVLPVAPVTKIVLAIAVLLWIVDRAMCAALESTILSSSRTNNSFPSLISCSFVQQIGRMAIRRRYFVAMSNPWKPVDPLGEALHFLRMTGVFYCRSEFTAPWGLALPPFPSCMMFHVVTSGQCWLEVDGAERCQLRPGDLALVPHGAGHRLVSDDDVRPERLFDLPRELISDRYEVLRHGGGGDAATVICGVVRFDHPAAEQLLRLLPRRIKVDAWSSPETEWIQSTLRFITAEARELRAGGETVITRLADILVIQSIRSWLAARSGGPNWLARCAAQPRDRPRDRADPSQPDGDVDRRIAREKSRFVALRVLGAFYGARGRARDALRDSLEDQHGDPVAARERRAHRDAREPARLRLRGRVQSRVQASRGQDSRCGATRRSGAGRRRRRRYFAGRGPYCGSSAPSS